MKFPLDHTLITKLAQFSDSLKEGEKFFTEVLAQKAKHVVASNPYDQTSLSMASLLSKRASKNTYITRKELKDFYQISFIPGNKFADNFSTELGLEKKAERKLAGEESVIKDVPSKTVLAEALESILANKPVKGFSERGAKSACHNLSYELSKIAIPKEVSPVVGNNSFIVCQASYETPKGVVSVLFPVKLASEDQAQFPNSFLATEGLVQLSKENLEKHIVSTAGKKLAGRADVLLAYLTKEAGSKDPLDELQFAAARIKAASGTAATYNTGIVYEEAFPKVAYIQDRKAEVPADLKPFTEKLGSQIGGAEFIFGKAAVDGAREFVLQGLARAGFKTASTKLTSFDKDGVVFAVSFLNKGFKVPVKIAAKVAQAPKFLIVNAGIKSFSSNDINEVLSSSEVDATAAFEGSVYSERSVGELNQILREAVAAGSTNTIEGVLAALQVKSQDSFRAGLSLYKESLLSGTDRLTKVASVASGCSKPMRSKNHTGFVCSHTGLPINKVYQNKFGSCQPLYRKELDEKPAEIAPLMSDKLFWK